MLRYTGQEAPVEHDLARTTHRCSRLMRRRRQAARRGRQSTSTSNSLPEPTATGAV